jgi:uncharacterized protein YhaN
MHHLAFFGAANPPKPRSGEGGLQAQAARNPLDEIASARKGIQLPSCAGEGRLEVTMRTYLILGLVAAACLCVLASGEALRRSDARLATERERAVDSRRASAAEREGLEDALEALMKEHLAEQRRLEAIAGALREDLLRAKEVSAQLQERLRASEERAANASRAWDTVQAELLAENDRLEKAYKDIEEVEKQLVDVSRAKNDIEQQLALIQAELKRQGIKLDLEKAVEYLRDGSDGQPGDFAVEPKIDGVVLGVSDKANLVLISVGKKDKVQVGYKFTVYRGSAYVSKLVVDKVEDGWSACRELKDFRKEEIQQGDNVSTRVFD